jgi:hypothetical protein
MKTLLLIAMLCLFVVGACQQPVTKTVQVEVPIPQVPVEQPPPVEPGKPGFLRFDEQEQYTDRDIKTLNAADRPKTRYLTTCNFLNQGVDDLDDYLAGVNKGLNMISTERLITKANVIDEAGCILRINLDDIGMTTEEWQKFERANALPFISESVRGRTLRALTNTNQPMVYASSFFMTVMQADQITIGNQLYYDLTEQPLNDAEFLQKLGINLQTEFNEEAPSCAGGGRSQIALGKPRLICIMDTTQDGFLMFTADTSLAKNDSIAENPFLGEMAAIPGSLTNKIFKFAAREWIFSMPNGLLTGYRLSNAGGTAEVIAPTNVVIDIEQSGKGLPPDITLGACSNCHHQQAAILFRDEVFNSVRNNGNFNTAEKELAEVFYRADRFQAKLVVANQNHERALREIGVSTLKQDPLVSNIIQPLRGELTAEDIAGYLSMEVGEFKIRLNGTNLSKVLFGALIDGGVVPTQDFVRGFSSLKDELLLFRDAGQL